MIDANLALVRPPTANLADGHVTHIAREPIDHTRAVQQWHSYVAALNDNGWKTVNVTPDPASPDAVFIEDTAVVFGSAALACRPGVESREVEVGPVAELLERLGYRIGRIEPPGTLDGGDILKVGSTIYIGRGGRTNAEGIAQAKAQLAAAGANVVPVSNTKVLHLKSAVTALPDGTIIGYEPLVEDPAVFPTFRAMPEEAGAHVVDLGDSRLLMAASSPASIEIVADLGYEPVVVDISEYEKLEGCVTCLSIRLRSNC